MTELFMLYSGAIIIGAAHAFEPGHGKTLIAAYMIGTKGRAWDGILLGAIVTITHTFSVILLGIVAKILSKTYSEATLHNWLGLISAGIILAVGIWMLRQRLSGKSGHTHIHLFGKGHDHSHDHEHHHPHTHSHEHNDNHNDNHAEDSHSHDNGHSHSRENHSPHTHTHDHDHAHASDEHEHTHEHHHPHAHSHEHNGYHEHSHHSHGQVATEHTHQDQNQTKAKKSPWELFMLGISGG
ncbi:MAG: hypothetical protein D3906_12030, partial [Candidatus Electrothrix sp. AUS1_2]|nr:hypothetical protein [Candidatus Electrothrix sp. AUS1_2]